MGGSLILGGILIPTLFWSDLSNPYIWIVLLTTLAFGVLGFLDDYKKMKDKKGIGIRARYKFPFRWPSAWWSASSCSAPLTTIQD